jgi:hypothetical protein
MSGEASGVPARGYSWPPAAPGNELAVKHGAYSPGKVKAKANDLLAVILTERPVWLDDVDQAALWAWCYAEARCELLRSWLDEHGQLDDSGEPRDAAKFLLQCERRASIERSRLGFDPLSRAQLGRDTAIARSAAADALDRVRETGRQALDSRECR